MVKDHFLLENQSMQPTALELSTIPELVEELMRRKTFLGVIVHSEEEQKGPWRGERMFKVRFNDNLDASETSRLLERVADHMDQTEDA
jgi:hypothetical protein